MPYYRVTLNHNVRAHRQITVEADCAESALRTAIDLDDWETLDTASQDLCEAEAEEPTFHVDLTDRHGRALTHSEEPIQVEFNHPDGYVYRDELLKFVKMVASCRGWYPETSDSDALSILIRYARAMLKRHAKEELDSED